MNTPFRSPGVHRHIGSCWSVIAVLTGGMFTAILQSACGDPTALPNPADLVLHVVSGDSQVGAPFEELIDPIVVQLIDTANNEPAYNQVINFRVIEGGGSVFAGVAHTNEAGIAQEYWTLGGPGPQLLEARAVTGEGEKVVFGTFSATAVEPFDSAPAFIRCMNTLPTWRPYPGCDFGVTWVDSVVTATFEVVNADSVPIPNVFVRFAVDTTVGGTMLQGGSVSPDSALTDSLGVVEVSWKLGPYPGNNRLEVVARGADGGTATVAAWAYGASEPAPHDTIPAYIRCLAENSWWRFDGACVYGPAPVKTTISATFQVVARDSQPLSNIPMFFVVDTTALALALQDGAVEPDSAMTDSAGVVTVRWTLGQHPGENGLFAFAVGSGVTLRSHVTAIGVSDSIPIDSVPAIIQCRDRYGVWREEGNCPYQSVAPGTAFPVTFRVTSMDTLPLSGVPVEFEITDGDGVVTPLTAVTDGIGQTTVSWMVGSYNVGQQLTARVPEWSLEVSVRVGVYQPQPEKLWWENASGGNWTGASNWSGNRVPRSGDTVVVRLPGEYTILAKSEDTLSMGSLEFGTVDTSDTQTLSIENSLFRVEGFGAVHPSGVIKVDSGGSYAGNGLLFVVGGQVHLFGGSWASNLSLDSGSFVFTGSQPKTLKAATIVGNGGSMVWTSTDTLLVLEDSAYIMLSGTDLLVEDTLAIVGGYLAEPLVVDSTSTVVFSANSVDATYLNINGIGVAVGGQILIETSAEPPPGTVFDLIRLVGGATLTGVPRLATAGYALSVNPEPGVGLRAVKN